MNHRDTDAGLVAYVVGVFLVTLLFAGCARFRAAAVGPASFSPEGRWRSSKLGVLTVHVQPDGSLLVIDPHGGKHPFQRVGLDRWQARVSREVIGTFAREEDQLVFRTTPTPEAQKPIAQKNGLAIVHRARRIEDRMTRVPETGPGSKAPK
jgi:hypothetical protein